MKMDGVVRRHGVNPRLSFPERVSIVAMLCLSSSSVLAVAESNLPGSASAVDEAIPESAIDWVTGSDVEFLGIALQLHVLGAFGGSTGDPAELATSDHDPQRDGANLQSFEPGVSIRWGESLEGFATYSAVTDAGGLWEGGLEEGFAKLRNLPGGIEIRGGQFLNRFGFQNALHNHAWNFVDQNLVNGRLLQEGELISIGGEVSWNAPTSFPLVIGASIGGLPQHGHGEEEAGEGEEEPEFEADAANFDNYVAGLYVRSKFDYNDFHQMEGTFSAAVGENEFGRTTQVYGVGFEYLWRQNGYAPGGRYLRWRTEAMIRGIGAVSGHGNGEEEDDHDEEEGDAEQVRENFSEFGITTYVACGLHDQFEIGLRGGFVSGIGEMGLDERWRLSPAITWFSNPQRTLQLRAQYDYDWSNEYGSDNSFWIQAGFNWGGPEVR